MLVLRAVCSENRIPKQPRRYSWNPKVFHMRIKLRTVLESDFAILNRRFPSELFLGIPPFVTDRSQTRGNKGNRYVENHQNIFECSSLFWGLFSPVEKILSKNGGIPRNTSPLIRISWGESTAASGRWRRWWISIIMFNERLQMGSKALSNVQLNTWKHRMVFSCVQSVFKCSTEHLKAVEWCFQVLSKNQMFDWTLESHRIVFSGVAFKCSIEHLKAIGEYIRSKVVQSRIANHLYNSVTFMSPNASKNLHLCQHHWSLWEIKFFAIKN